MTSYRNQIRLAEAISTLEVEKKKLQDEIEESNKNLDHFKLLCDNLQNDNENLTNENENQQEKINNLERINQQYRNTMTPQVRQINELRQSNESIWSYQNKIRILEYDLELKENQINKLNQRNLNLKGKSEKLDQENTLLEKEVSDLKNIHEEEKKKFQDEIQKSNKLYNSLEERYKDLTNKNNKKINQHQMIVKDLNEKINDIKERNARDVQQIEQKHQNKIKSQEEKINQLQESLEKNTLLKDEVSNLKNMQIQLTQSFEEEKKKFQDEINNYKLLCNNLQEKYNKEFNEEKNQHQVIIKELNDEIKDIKERNVRDVQQLKQNHQNKIKSQEEKINQLQQSLEKNTLLKDETSNLKNTQIQLTQSFEEEKKKFQDEINNYKLLYNNLQEKYNKEFNEEKNQHQMIVKELNEEIKDIKERNVRDVQQLKQNHQNKIKSQEEKINQLQQSLEKSTLLKDEASNLKNTQIQLTQSFEEEKKKFQNEINNYKLLYNNLQEKYNEEFNEEKNQHQIIVQKLNNNIKENKEQYSRKVQQLENQINSTNQQYQSKFNSQDSENNNLRQKNKNIKKKLDDLVQQNSLLKGETQSAIGIATIATNFSLNDENNNNDKLNKDILELHNTLENYANLKSKIQININEVKNLLDQYGCKLEISDKEPNKPLIKAVLQRHVLEEILRRADSYFKHSDNQDHYLESNIVSQTIILTKLIEKFQNNRLGDNEISRFTLIRLRQQVYNMLCTQGFNDIKKSDNENSKHDFIKSSSLEINEMMNKYRIIKDIEKKEYVDSLAEGLIRNVIRIFHFRLFIQEPIAQYRWFKNNEKINKSLMKGSWNEDDSEDMIVEVCSFPLIFKPSHPDGFKVFTPAKVFPPHNIKNCLMEKLGNTGSSIENIESSVKLTYK